MPRILFEKPLISRLHGSRASTNSRQSRWSAGSSNRKWPRCITSDSKLCGAYRSPGFEMPASAQNRCASDDSCCTPYLQAVSGLTSLHTSHECENDVPIFGGEQSRRFSGSQNRVTPSAGSNVTRPCIDAQGRPCPSSAKNPELRYPGYLGTIDMSQHTRTTYCTMVVQSTKAGAQRACAAAALAARRVQRALRRATDHLTRGRATPPFSGRSDDAGRARSDSSPATAGGSLQGDLRHCSSSADVARTRYHGHALCVCAQMQSRRPGVSLVCDLQHEAEAGCVHRP